MANERIIDLIKHASAAADSAISQRFTDRRPREIVSVLSDLGDIQLPQFSDIENAEGMITQTQNGVMIGFLRGIWAATDSESERQIIEDSIRDLKAYRAPNNTDR